jgi:hypothetical protein
MTLKNKLIEWIDVPLISFGGTTMPSGGLLMSSTVVGVETPLPLATAAAILSLIARQKGSQRPVAVS